MKKWFSFNPETQKVDTIEASEEYFQKAPSTLLYWSRGLEEWVKAPEALGHYLVTNSPPQEPIPSKEPPEVLFPLKAEVPSTKKVLTLKEKADRKKKTNKKR